MTTRPEEIDPSSTAPALSECAGPAPSIPGPGPAITRARRELSVLIVTYNSSRWITALLACLAKELIGLAAEVIVIDNASQDGSAEEVARTHPWVRLLRSPSNLGFAAANNVAAKHALGRVLLLLNPDATPAPGSLRRGLEILQTDDTIGLAGGRLTDTSGRLQPSARMFPSFLQEFIILSGLAGRFPRSKFFGHVDRTWANPAVDADVDWIPGAFAFVRSDAFTQLGGFDERFFLYYEEVDLCRRLRQAGYRIQYRPELHAYHLGGASAQTVTGAIVARAGSQLTLWRARSGLLYYRKNHGWLTAWAVNRLERGWHRLRAARARAIGQPLKMLESSQHRALLAQAWVDTLGGQIAPPRPW